MRRFIGRGFMLDFVSISFAILSSAKIKLPMKRQTEKTDKTDAFM